MSTIQRVTGTNSGLDVDSLVKSAMTTYQNKIDKENQNKKVLEYQQEQYQKIMSDASDFYDKYFDVLKTGNLFSSSTYQSVSFKSGDDSKVTAKGFAGADVSDYKVSVTQLATKASHTITATELDDVKASASKEGVMSVKVGSTNVYVDVAFNADKTAIDMDTTAKNLNTALNAKGIDVTAKYSEFSKGIVLESGTMGKDVQLEVAIQKDVTESEIASTPPTTPFTALYTTYKGTNAEGVITKGTQTYAIDQASNIVNVDNVQFTLKGVTTSTSTNSKYITSSSISSLLGDNISKVATSSSKVYTLTDGSKITMADDGSITLANSDGTTNPIELTSADGLTTRTINSDGTLMTQVKDSGGNIVSTTNNYITTSSITSLFSSDITKIGDDNSTEYTLTNGSKIKIKDDGTTTVTGTNGSTVLGAGDTVDIPKADGTTVTLKGDGTLTGSTDNTVTLTGSTDVTALKDKIVSFVNDYNTLLSSINTKIYETRDKDYMPLTDTQKASMTSDQITAWEKKAQTGLLRKDNNLERITSAMKSAMSSLVSGSGLYLEKIGITPVDNYQEKNGLYTIDEDKLTTALEENAGNIKDLFTRDASTGDNGGIFTQLKSTLYSEFKSSTSVLSQKAGLDGTSTQYSNTLTQSIYKETTLIADLNTKFTEKQTALYNKYSALETAMQNLNAQQSSLTSMLGQG